VHVWVDPDVCQGTGYCVRVLPQVFTLGEEGYATTLVEHAGEALHEALEEAERLCPVGAVILRP
jgi:ferredoxin